MIPTGSIMLMNLEVNEYNESVVLFNMIPTEGAVFILIWLPQVTNYISRCEDRDMSMDERFKKEKSWLCGIIAGKRRKSPRNCSNLDFQAEYFYKATVDHPRICKES